MKSVFFKLIYIVSFFLAGKFLSMHLYSEYLQEVGVYVSVPLSLLRKMSTKPTPSHKAIM